MNGSSINVPGVPLDMTRQASASVFQQSSRPRRRGHPTSRKADALAGYSVRAVLLVGYYRIIELELEPVNNNMKKRACHKIKQDAEPRRKPKKIYNAAVFSTHTTAGTPVLYSY